MRASLALFGIVVIAAVALVMAGCGGGGGGTSTPTGQSTLSVSMDSTTGTAKSFTYTPKNGLSPVQVVFKFKNAQTLAESSYPITNPTSPCVLNTTDTGFPGLSGQYVVSVNAFVAGSFSPADTVTYSGTVPIETSGSGGGITPPDPPTFP